MCTFDTNKIYLTWKKTFESSRRIVAILEKKENSYKFYYIKENIELAKKEGFQYYPAFQDLDKIYTENVLENFQRRLLNPARRDYKDFLSYWEANDYEDNIFALLGLTGAKLLTDNFEFIAPHDEMPARFLTNVSRINLSDKNVVDEAKTLSNSELQKRLSLVQDKTNSYDNKAIKVLFDKNTLGFIKSIHCHNIYNALEQQKQVSFEVKNVIKNGTIKEILLKININ